MHNRRSWSLPTRRLIAASVLGAAALVAPNVLLPGFTLPPAAAAEPPIPDADGLSELTAAASCWEIKQNDPGSTSGVYWLATPAMGAAEQFYCDQERAGGGWVLIGRGREAWSVANIGSGTPAQVRATVTGTAAFTPRQLSSELIEDLVNGEAISSLPDGVRLVRARNTAGTQWHETTFTFSSPREGWTWQFSNDQRIKNYTMDGQSYSGGYTANFGRDNNYNRVRMTTGSYEGWHMGFGYGSNIRGQNTPDSFLWSKNTSTGYARPFTQVFLRPQLLSSDVYSPIPSSGTPATSGPAVADGFALAQSWGVAGLGAGPASIEGSNEVSAFTESGSRVFVGGNFTRVQRSASGQGTQNQSYLAAFDRDSGEWIPDFRPTFNNQVKALAALPGGRIAAGGYFTQVNGQPRAGLVVLNAATGEIDPNFTGRLINYLSGGVAVVRTLDVQDDWLYAGGSFTHSTGGTETREVYTRAAARFDVSDGTANQPWNPEFNGTVMSVDASERGDRVFFAGFFSQSKGRTAEKAAALAADSEDLFAWAPLFSNRSGGRTGYQQAVKEVGDRVWLGGSEHSLFSYSRDDFSLLSTTIGNNGGDFQAIATDGHAVYGGCHCFETQYEGATTWPNVGQAWTEANAIYGTGAWDSVTGRAIPAFNGTFTTRGGAGSWALFVDSAGTLWQGGDWTSSTQPGYQKQWSGGFTRHAQRDTAAPSTPTDLFAATNSEGTTLTWEPAQDDRAVSTYEVLRNDRVVAAVTDTTVTLPPAPADTHYFVRAVDAQGNKSASTPGTTSDPGQDPPETEVLITTASPWKYRYKAAAPDGDWTTPGFDDSTWDSGPAPLGWGQADLGTILTATGTKPLVSLYRHSFELAAESDIESIDLTTRADDGIVLYVNGTEVTRVNVDAGPVGVGTYANAAVSAGAALANPVTVTVPRSALVAGTNTISASVHSNYRNTPSHSFELSAVAVLGEMAPLPDPSVDPPPEPEPHELIGAGADWSYEFSQTAPTGDWTTPGFDDSTWDSGPAPLGWGHSGLGTTLDGPSPRPVVSLYRHEFTFEPETTLTDVTITTRADDGVVLYVNGTEVTRVNIDPGPVLLGAYPTYANTAVSAGAAVANLITVTVPAEAFTTGANVIAASVHSNYRSTPSHSFELTAVAEPGDDAPAARMLLLPESEAPESAAPSGPVLDDAPVEPPIAPVSSEPDEHDTPPGVPPKVPDSTTPNVARPDPVTPPQDSTSTTEATPIEEHDD